MDIGISYWFGYPSLPDERIGLLKQFGFSNVSLHWTNEYENVTGKKETVLDRLYSCGIAVSSFHLSFDRAKLLWDYSLAGIRYRQEVLQAIDDAKKFNVKMIIMHTDGTLYSSKRLHLLEEILAKAEKADITICLENLQIEDNLTSIIQEMSSCLNLCYDSGHANIRPCPFPREDNRSIRYCHINDNLGTNDIHMIPGTGNIDWYNEKKVLNSLPCASSGIFEVHGNLSSRVEAEEYLDNVAKSIKSFSSKGAI